jgi:signal transduction histidine kinase
MISNQSVRYFDPTSSTFNKGVSMRKALYWVAKRHWWFIVLLVFFLTLLEYFDFSRQQHDPIHLLEFIIYAILLLMIGALFDSLLRVLNIRTKFMNIIDYKHKLSLEFSVYNDWDVLVTQLARFPSTIAAVEKASLFVFDSFSTEFELAAQWPTTGEYFADLRSIEGLQKHLRKTPDDRLTFRQCQSESLSAKALSQAQVFCLPIQYGKNLLGIMQFKLKQGETLTSDQDYIFKNIGDEFAFVLKAGQERKKYYEMTTSETTLAERRRVSRYLHDHLGHNLGYLHFKLDQLVSMKDQISPETIVNDLEHMRKAAQESYEIVRGTLETIRPETSPLLTNLLLEHARKISKRANLEIDFKTKGKPMPLPIDVNQAIFYVFEEALCNTEKHSRANKVDVLAEWGESEFVLTISDNGVGFNPQDVNVDQHFGLEILHERMDKVHGQVSLSTTENSGTTVFVRVPSPPIPQLERNL